MNPALNKLLIITQKVDANDDLLGFFIGWLREFSRYFDKVFVITLAKGKYDLPANVHVYSLGKEKHANSAPPPLASVPIEDRGSSTEGRDNANVPMRIFYKLIYLFRLYKLLFKLVPKSDGIFAHMSPIFAVASWPIAQFYKKRIILWYLHRAVTFRLRLAVLLSYKVVTASLESLGVRSSKILAIGHGIDIERFDFSRHWSNEGLLDILSVGRISPIKNYETLVGAAAILKNKGVKFSVQIIGRPVMGGDRAYFKKLEILVKRQGLEKLVRFVGFVPFSQIPEYYRNAAIVINLAPCGGIDKTVLEAMASGALVLVSNRVFADLFGVYADDLIFEENNSEELFSKIQKLNNYSAAEKSYLSDFLKLQVFKYHDLNKTIRLISKLF